MFRNQHTPASLPRAKNKADSQTIHSNTHKIICCSISHKGNATAHHSIYEPRSLTRARVRRIPAFLSVALTTYVILLYRFRFVNHFSRYFPQPFHTSPLDLSSHRRISKIHNAFLSDKTTTFLLSKKEPATVSLLSSAFSAASPFSIPTSP